MPNIAAQVWDRALDRPGKDALRSARGNLSYSELVDRSRRYASAVKAAGIAPGDRVVLIAPTVLEFAIVYYGLLGAGATVITMNTMATPAEISYVLSDSEASLLLAWHESAASATTASVGRGIPLWIVREGAFVDDEPLHEAHAYQASDTAVILYTSGTTGRPKGAELTAANLEAAALVFTEEPDFTPDDVFATALPLFHVFGQAVVMNPILATGATLCIQYPFQARAMLDLIATGSIKMISGVPTMWNAMLHEASREPETDFRRLAYLNSGGAALPVEVLLELQKRFGAEILEGYGLTETTAVATKHGSQIEKRAGTVGIVAPFTEVEVRSVDGGEVLGADSVGEVFVRGATVMKGYWNRPEATAEVLVDGWLRTGDLGAFDSDGYLRIVDRVKDLIIRGGYNVYPREVEEVLMEHPDVLEVAVLGIADEHYGEEVAAALVLRPGSTLTPDELRTWAKTQLSAYKVPRVYQFLDTLPKGSTGKVLKRAIDRASFETAASDPTAAR